MAVIRQFQPNRQPPAPEQGRDDAEAARGPGGLSDTSPPGARRLLALMHADVAGYSRLIAMDDAGTVQRLQELRRALIDPALRRHSGQIVQTGGDSVLVVFDSIEGAVDCAVEVQRQLPVYDAYQPPDRHIRFRIGIEVGDAIPEAGDLHGEAVNIAARLQAACPPGGVCISRAVHEHIQDRLGGGFVLMGALELKNIGHPVEAFVLRLGSAAEPLPRWRRRRVRLAVAAAAVVLLVVAALGAWWPGRPLQEARLPAPAAPAPSAPGPDRNGLAHAPRLSLVVLPFDNLDRDPAQEHVVDGFTDDLTTELARYTGMLVTARNSAFTYKGKPYDVRRIGEELGVRYAVEGSVRKVGDALRVNIQVVSTENGDHIWADRLDSRPGAGLDEPLPRTVRAITQRLADTEIARGQRERPGNPNADDLFLQAEATYFFGSGQPNLPEVIGLCERALALDPSHHAAMVVLVAASLDLLPDENDPRAAAIFDRAEHLMAKAEALDPDGMSVLWIKGFMLRTERRNAEAVVVLQRALALYPNEAQIESQLAESLNQLGRPAEALPHIERAMRLNPLSMYVFYRRITTAMALLGRYEEAVVWGQRTLDGAAQAPTWYRAMLYRLVAPAQEMLGRHEAASKAATEIARLNPFYTVRAFEAQVGGPPSRRR